MSAIVPADLVDAVNERAAAKLRMLMSEVATRQTRNDGTTYGDVILDRGGRIEQMLDLAIRGVLDHLVIVKPALVDRKVKQFLKDVIGTPLENHPATAVIREKYQ